MNPTKNEDKLRYWAESTLEALKYIHTYGVIHVDLKLENLLMQSSERDDEYSIPKLCDFGLSHVIDYKEGQGKKAFMEVLCGTHGYTAPEQR